MSRLSYLDNLKSALIVLVLGHHLAIGFGGDGFWYYKLNQDSASTNQVLAIFNTINQSFFMSLFFFISAYFIPPSYDKKTTKHFLIDKLWRLGIPLVVFFFIASPLIAFWVNWLNPSSSSTYFSMGPLWFVAALLLFNVFYLCCAKMKTPFVKINCPGFLSCCLIILIMGTITWIVRLWFPVGRVTLGFQLAYFPLYILFFCGGILASRNAWLGSDFKKFKPLWVLSWLLSISFIIYAHYWPESQQELAAGGVNRYAVLLAFWEPISCFSWIILGITLFKRYLNFTTDLTQYAALAAYAVYVLQPFFIIFITLIWGWMQWQGLGGFVGAWIVCTLLSFYIAGWIRSFPVINTIL